MKNGAFCNTFDLHYLIIGLENQFSVFLRLAVLRRFYCYSIFLLIYICALLFEAIVKFKKIMSP